jgi:hypothetical protein
MFGNIYQTSRCQNQEENNFRVGSIWLSTLKEILASLSSPELKLHIISHMCISYISYINVSVWIDWALFYLLVRNITLHSSFLILRL